MRDQDCIDFLLWALPRLGLRWPGYRKVRGTVCKRVTRRIRELCLADLDAYRSRLEADAAEWVRLDAMCRIPISRFWRDRAVFDFLAGDVLPGLAAAAGSAGRREVRAWSAGCASGEEPYSLRLAWGLQAERSAPPIRIAILATDADATMLARAHTGLYQASSLRHLPAALAERAFTRDDDLYQIRPELRRDIIFVQQDIRAESPAGPFDLILVRNLIFTYFDAPSQRALLARLCTRLVPGAALVIGRHETVPNPHDDLIQWDGPAPIFQFRRKVAPNAGARSPME